MAPEHCQPNHMSMLEHVQATGPTGPHSKHVQWEQAECFRGLGVLCIPCGLPATGHATADATKHAATTAASCTGECAVPARTTRHTNGGGVGVICNKHVQNKDPHTQSTVVQDPKYRSFRHHGYRGSGRSSNSRTRKRW